MSEGSSLAEAFLPAASIVVLKRRLGRRATISAGSSAPPPLMLAGDWRLGDLYIQPDTRTLCAAAGCSAAPAPATPPSPASLAAPAALEPADGQAPAPPLETLDKVDPPLETLDKGEDASSEAVRKKLLVPSPPDPHSASADACGGSRGLGSTLALAGTVPPPARLDTVDTSTQHERLGVKLAWMVSGASVAGRTSVAPWPMAWNLRSSWRRKERPS